MKATLFTGAALLDLLSQIEELADKSLDLAETDLGYQITIGESTYNILPSEPTEVEVEADVLDSVADAHLDTLLDMEEEGVVQLRELRDTEDSENVEGGPILNLIKTLFVGGLVRLGSKAVGKDIAEGLLKQAAKSNRR